MANREKVPSVYWVAQNNARQVGRYWVATFANEGAEKLAEYIVNLRQYWKDIPAKDRADRADVAAIGAHAVAIYRKHFGEF